MTLGDLVQYYDLQRGWHCGYLRQIKGKRARIEPTKALNSTKRVRCKWVELVNVQEIREGEPSGHTKSTAATL